MKALTHVIIIALALAFAGCGDDQVKDQTTGPVEANQSSSAVPPPVVPEIPSLPEIVTEDLDQAQERYDEQVVSSFGVKDRGWQSYKAGKSGYLTRFTLFGCAHSKNKIYGDAIYGEILVEKTGERIGTWSLSRDEVISQLKSRGLRETDYDWIDVRISNDQRITQVAGESYVIRSTRISGQRHWFGSFRVGVGDCYPDGAWWHAKFPQTKEPDLVFRTYVGKTTAQLTAERAEKLRQVEEQLNGAQKTSPTDPVGPKNEAPQPIIPPGEFLPLPPEDPPPPPSEDPPPEPEAPSPSPVVEENASKKPLLPFLRPK